MTNKNKEQAKEKKVAVNFKMDEKTKMEWELVCDNLGITITGAITMLAKQMIVEQGLPFKPGKKTVDNEEMFKRVMAYSELLSTNKEKK